MTTETQREQLYDGLIFEHQDHFFRFRIEPDSGMGEPWKEHDGHGIVSDWTLRDKKPGERVLASDRQSKRYYDVAETILLARKDGWGASDKGVQALTSRLGRTPTPKELTALAVDEDFERMKDWCEDRWTWVGIVVTLLKDDDDAPEGYFETRHQASLWGIESDGDSYLSDEGYNLAEELIAKA